MAYDFRSVYNIPGGRSGGSVTTYNTPSAGVTGGLQSLVDQYNRAYGEARSANEARYQQALQTTRGGYDTSRGEVAGGYDAALGTLGSMSGQRQADIRGASAQSQASMMQRLSRQGLSGTTIAPTMKMGIQREEQSSLNRLADLIAQQTAGLQTQRGTALGGLETQRTGALTGLMERRTDAYPDLGSLQSIIAGVGSQYGGGQGLDAMLRALSQIRQ